MGNIKGSDHYYLGKIPGWNKTHLTGCIGEIIGFHRRLTDEETSYIHQYLMTNYHKITEWLDSSIGQSTVIQQLDKKG